MNTKPRKLTKGDWTGAALELLRTQGVGGVRVLSLAKRLKVTRGSFYWHFRDRNDLLDAMLAHWEQELTDSVIRHAEATRGDARKRLVSLAEFILRRDLNRYDSAIRSWADGDRRVASVLRRVMKKRLAYVSSLFRDAGFSPTEAAARGHLLAIYIMSEATIHMGESLESRLQLLRRQIRTLTRTD